jgi:ActR/RegA family two-component response regulator
MKRLHHTFTLLSLSAVSFRTVFLFFQERPFFAAGSPPGKESRTALAIRDPELPFAQWGSYLSTKGHLDRCYSNAKYFTQSKRDDCREEFIPCLVAALLKYPIVDIYLLARTNSYIDAVNEIPEEHRKWLRFVYNTGCYNLKQGLDCLKVGAKACIGHPGNSTSVIFYVSFLRRRARNQTLFDAMNDGNARMERAMRVWNFLTVFYRNRLVAIPSGGWKFFREPHDIAAAMAQSRAQCLGDCGMTIGEQP